MARVQSINEQLHFNSFTVKKKNISIYLDFSFSPRENYFLYQLAIQIKVPFQMICCPNYEILSVL